MGFASQECFGASKQNLSMKLKVLSVTCVFVVSDLCLF